MPLTRKFGPAVPATDADLPPLFPSSNGRTVVENPDGTRWTLYGTQECRKLRWQRINGKRVRSAVPAFATLGLFSRPCATPGCRGHVRARVSLGAVAVAGRIGAFSTVRCDKCRARRAARTPEQLAADRKAARAAYDAKRYAARKVDKAAAIRGTIEAHEAKGP